MRMCACRYARLCHNIAFTKLRDHAITLALTLTLTLTLIPTITLDQ